jgi:hypothetical protein
MKFIIFDPDRSLATIGSPEAIEKLSGFRAMPIDMGLAEIKTYLTHLFSSKQVEVEHPLFKTVKKEWEIILSPLAEEQGLEGVVIDTISTAGLQTRNAMVEKARPNAKGYKAMEMQDWGAYGQELSAFAQMLSKLPTWVVVNAHADYSMDDKLGCNILTPAVKGAGKFEIARYFDVVLYSKVVKSKGKSEYYWVTKPDERMPLAKDRNDLLESVIPQDLGAIIRAYKEAGLNVPKILVIGDSGQGKTHALKTLTKGTKT